MGFTISARLPDSMACERRHGSNKGSRTMDKDRIKGTVKKAEGAIKEALGKASGDESLEVEGKIEKAEGSIQKAFGKAKDSLRKS
jgi:uncharacterized protein YjbJ (UPF0337 family)